MYHVFPGINKIKLNKSILPGCEKVFLLNYVQNYSRKFKLRNILTELKITRYLILFSCFKKPASEASSQMEFAGQT